MVAPPPLTRVTFTAITPTGTVQGFTAEAGLHSSRMAQLSTTTLPSDLVTTSISRALSSTTGSPYPQATGCQTAGVLYTASHAINTIATAKAA